jgi:hypothetical protein
MPVWLTILLAVLAIFSPGALIGVWLGTSMSQRGAERLSKQTLDGQRTLARDAALRKWRRQQIAPYLEAANQRVTLWLEMSLEKAHYNALLTEGPKMLSEAEFKENEAAREEAMQALMSQLIDSHFPSLVIRRNVVPDLAFKEALERFALAEGPVRMEYTLEDIEAVQARMRPALAALHEAAERYIFGAA